MDMKIPSITQKDIEFIFNNIEVIVLARPGSRDDILVDIITISDILSIIPNQNLPNFT